MLQINHNKVKADRQAEKTNMQTRGLEGQLSEACLHHQCTEETESPISPDPLLFCTGS